jgi:hypothetical protein
VINLAVKVVLCFVTEFYSIVGCYFVIIFMKPLSCVRLVVVVNTCNSQLLIEYYLLHMVKRHRTSLSFCLYNISCEWLGGHRSLVNGGSVNLMPRHKMVEQTVQFKENEHIILLDIMCRGYRCAYL